MSIFSSIKNVFIKKASLVTPEPIPIPKEMQDELTGEFVPSQKRISITFDGRNHVFSSKNNMRLWMASNRMLIGYSKITKPNNNPTIIHDTMRKKFGRTDPSILIKKEKKETFFRNMTELNAWLIEGFEKSPLD